MSRQKTKDYLERTSWCEELQMSSSGVARGRTISNDALYREEEEREFVEFARAQDPVAEERIVQHMAPGIFGLENVKRAIACLLFGGTRKVCISVEGRKCA
jgi:DNA replicative helicase MCM subunit Mcm2 (Cdc46/Mcm family)